MKKNLLYSTFYLIILSTIGKILSFGVRIYLARQLPLEAMSTYSLAVPSLIFLIALAQMGIPSALSKVIAESKNQLNGILSAFILSTINNFVLLAIYIFIIPLLAKNLYHDIEMTRILRSMIYMIPMVTLSGLCKAILQGNQYHLTACASQIFEEIFRFVYLVIRFSNPVENMMEYASIAMFSIFIGEVGSTLYMLLYLFIKKHPIKRRQHDLRKSHFYEILALSIPMTSARLIGSFTYFLEPLLFLSFSNHILLEEAYGIFNGYVLPLVTMPSFISITLSSVLLPTFVYHKKHNHLDHAMHIFYLMSFICIFISTCCALITFIFPNQILHLFYQTTNGNNMLKMISIPFILYSLQPVFSSILHALNQSNQALIDTIIGCAIRLLLILFLTSQLNENALLLSITSSMLITTLLHGIRIYLSIKRLKNFS